MPAFRFDKFLLAAISGVALAALVQPGAGFAYTPEQQQACTPDAMRLCGEFIPNVDAITACMIQKKAQLSPQCRAFFRPGPGEAAATPSAQPVSLQPRATKKSAGKPAAKKKTTASKKKKSKADET
jgi:hypothetical protein